MSQAADNSPPENPGIPGEPGLRELPQLECVADCAFRRWMIWLFVVSTLIAFNGIAWLPLDGHEAFVVQTAQEMRERGDWIVPYFNAKPRLTKPPLSYWLTMGIAAAPASVRSS